MAVKALRDMLIVDPTVTSLVGSGDDARISPLMREQSEPLPAIVVTESVEPLNYLTGPGGIDHHTYTVDSFAATYEGASALADACRAAVEAAGHICISQQDNFDASAELSGIYSVTQEFSVWI